LAVTSGQLDAAGTIMVNGPGQKRRRQQLKSSGTDAQIRCRIQPMYSYEQRDGLCAPILRVDLNFSSFNAQVKDPAAGIRSIVGMRTSAMWFRQRICRVRCLTILSCLARPFLAGPADPMILPAASQLPLKVTAHTGNVALRVPSAEFRWRRAGGENSITARQRTLSGGRVLDS